MCRVQSAPYRNGPEGGTEHQYELGRRLGDQGVSLRSRRVPFDRLLQRGPSASIVVRLMMACNDLALANDALLLWKSEDTNRRRFRKLAAGRYFVRLQFAHLHEGLAAVEALLRDKQLLAFLNHCDYQTRASLDKLKPYLKDGAEYAKFDGFSRKLRSNVVFHYHEGGRFDWISRALAALSPQSGEIQIGTEPVLVHFDLADQVVEEIVLREIWKVPPGEAQPENADAVATYCHEVFKAFMDFSIYFAWEYCEK